MSKVNQIPPRNIYLIAKEIRANWKNVYFAAKPYLDAMDSLATIEDKYYCDSAESVILYFLCNAGTWRGEDARRIKAELKAIAKLK